MSHLKILQNAVDNNLDHVLIVEDDDALREAIEVTLAIKKIDCKIS